MDLIPGKLYKTAEYFLLVYPTKEKAALAVEAPATAAFARSPSATTTIASAAMVAPAGASSAGATAWGDYWSKQLNCQVCYSELGELFMFLERNGVYLHVLFGDKQGWIIYDSWLHIEEALNGI